MLKKIGDTVIVIVAAIVIFAAAIKLGDINFKDAFAKTENTAGKTDTSSVGTTTVNGDSEDGHEHVYESATGNICTVCGYEFEPIIKEVIGTYSVLNDNCAVRSYYYQGDNIVMRLNAQEEVKVVGILTNALEHDWYITVDGYYIYESNLAKVSED